MPSFRALVVLLGSLVFPPLVWSCGSHVGDRTTPPAVSASAVLSTGTDAWWSAVAHLDLDAARALDEDPERRAFLDALAAALEGGSGAAERPLCALATGAADPQLRRRAGQLALNLLRIEGRWEALADFGARCGLSLKEGAIPAALLHFPAESVELPEEPVVLPLLDRDKRWPLVAVHATGPGGSEELISLLDTGAGTCVIASDAARRLGVTPVSEDQVAILGSAGQGAGARPGVLPELRMGGLRATDVPVLIVDAEAIESLLPGVSFMIGWELLQRMVVEISGATGELILRRSAPRPADVALNLVLLHEPVVRLASSGTELLFLLDTGSTSTSATPGLVERLDLTDLSDVHDKIRGLGGEREAVVPEIPHLVVMFGSVRLELGNVSVWEMPIESQRLLSLDGTLGADVAMAGRLIIDGPGRRVTFTAK